MKNDLQSRRRFIKNLTTAGAAISLLPTTGFSLPNIRAGTAHAVASSATADPLSFLIVTDTHYDARVGDKTDELVQWIDVVNKRLLDRLNELPGKALPNNIGGTEVTEPRAVIHLGDMIDSGDKTGAIWEARQHTEWDEFVRDYGMTGTDGHILRYPVYELFGNHDSTREWTPALEGIYNRNQSRLDRGAIMNLEPEYKQHCSWDWGGIHFITLGHVVGHHPDGLEHGRMEPFNSYDFLVNDLARNVGDTGKPVVLLQHVDIFRFSDPDACDPDSSGRTSDWWHPCDVRAYHEALQGYNVVGIFHGHLHGRQIGTWDGTNNQGAPGGYRIMGSNNSAAGGGNRAFWYCRVEDEELVVREAFSTGTETGWAANNWGWRSEVWRLPLYQ